MRPSHGQMRPDRNAARPAETGRWRRPARVRPRIRRKAWARYPISRKSVWRRARPRPLEASLGGPLDVLGGGAQPWLTPEGIAVKPVYTAADTRRPRLPRQLSRHRALPARALPDHVRHAAVDHPPVRRLLDGRGFQRLLSAQHRRRPEGPVGRLRSRHAPRLRQRPSARARRRRHGGRRHRFHLRHAHAVRRHSARTDDACR